MTAREPSAVEVIAEHQYDLGAAKRGDARCLCGETLLPTQHGRGVDFDLAAHQVAALRAAGFVVATRDEIRAMSPAEQAELIGGKVVRQRMPQRMTWKRDLGLMLPDRSSEATFESASGPWREVQP